MALNWKPLTRRYVTTLKTLLIVFLGAFLANGHAEFPFQKVAIAAFFATLLWAGLYTLNESTDQYLENAVLIKPWIVITSWSVILTSLIGSRIFSGKAVFLMLCLMTLCQLLYSTHTVRLKEHVWAAPLFTGITNPTLRMLTGVVVTVNSNTPWNIIYLSAMISVAMHLAFALKTRTYRKERDKKLSYTYIPDYFANTYLEPLQYLSPVGLFYYLILLNFLIRGNFFPRYIVLPTIPIVIIYILIVWRTNNLYDEARHKNQPLSIELYHGLCLAKIRQIVNFWEIITIVPIYSYVAFQMTPVSFFIVTIGLVAYKSLTIPPTNSDR